MDRKNINRGFKKLRVWQDAVSLYVLACRTPILGCHIYQCKDCGHVELIAHSCKSRFWPTCGKHATDVWANQVLNGFLDVPYHHLIMAIPWSRRGGIIIMNRKADLNLLVHAATEAIEQWARDIKFMRMGIQTFGWGADEKTAHVLADLYVEAGGNIFDTADIYNNGVSESMLGSWLGHPLLGDGLQANIDEISLRRQTVELGGKTAGMINQNNEKVNSLGV